MSKFLLSLRTTINLWNLPFLFFYRYPTRSHSYCRHDQTGSSSGCQGSDKDGSESVPADWWQQTDGSGHCRGGGDTTSQRLLWGPSITQKEQSEGTTTAGIQGELIGHGESISGVVHVPVHSLRLLQHLVVFTAAACGHIHRCKGSRSINFSL